eukprot:177616-Amphidinium_carterae.1
MALIAFWRDAADLQQREHNHSTLFGVQTSQELQGMKPLKAYNQTALCVVSREQRGCGFAAVVVRNEPIQISERHPQVAARSKRCHPASPSRILSSQGFKSNPWLIVSLGDQQSIPHYWLVSEVMACWGGGKQFTLRQFKLELKL